MDFIIEALDAYEIARAEPGWDGPTHSVRVPVMSGASAGGMTAAISALHAFHRLEHVWPGKPAPPTITIMTTKSMMIMIMITCIRLGHELIKGIPRAIQV